MNMMVSLQLQLHHTFLMSTTIVRNSEKNHLENFIMWFPNSSFFVIKNVWIYKNTVAFLTTCVKEPDLDNKMKLIWNIKYLRATKNIVLTLKGNPSSEIFWWVDAVFAVHIDVQSHTGRVLSPGHGAIYVTSKNKNLTLIA